MQRRAIPLILTQYQIPCLMNNPIIICLQEIPASRESLYRPPPTEIWDITGTHYLRLPQPCVHLDHKPNHRQCSTSTTCVWQACVSGNHTKALQSLDNRSLQCTQRWKPRHTQQNRRGKESLRTQRISLSGEYIITYAS